MPIHDWTRASDAAYHSFQLSWASALCERLNASVLPSSHFAVGETLDLRPNTGLPVWPEPDGPLKDDDGEAEPSDSAVRARYRCSDDRVQYACRIVTVRDECHQPTAAVFWVARQDRQTPYRLDAVVHSVVGCLTREIHVLVVDLFPPSRRDPQGLHKLIWDRLQDEDFALPPDKPLTLASYAAGVPLRGYIEPVAVGDDLPDMPLFLTPYRYVPCPLAATYDRSWAAFPKALRAPLESQ